jgi:hypothetical protein
MEALKMPLRKKEAEPPKPPESPLKRLRKQYGPEMRTHIEYAFGSNTKRLDEFAQRVVSEQASLEKIIQLVKDTGVHPEVAFFLHTSVEPEDQETVASISRTLDLQTYKGAELAWKLHVHRVNYNDWRAVIDRMKEKRLSMAAAIADIEEEKLPRRPRQPQPRP